MAQSADSETVSASEHFAAGTRAFEAGDYDQALEEFQAAINAGSDGPAVRYNVAVSHYRLADYASAEDAFRNLGRRFPEMRDLAEYNLGLALTRLNRLDDARAAFERAQASDDEQIASLATTMLTRLPARQPRQSPAAWTRFVGLWLGYDDNVALIDEVNLPAGQSTDSPFTELVGYVGGPAASDGRWRFDGSAYLVTYPDASEFDQLGIDLALNRHWRADDWRISAGPRMTRSTLDGDGFEGRLGVSVELGHATARRTSFAVRLVHDSVDSVEDQFAYLDGNETRIELQVERAFTAGRLSFDYRIENSDRAGAGISADRNRYRLRYRRLVGSAWTLGLLYEHRISDYDSLAVPRDEQRDQAGFEATRRFATNWQMSGQYRYTDNDSSDLRYAYERTRISVGVSKTF